MDPLLLPSQPVKTEGQLIDQAVGMIYLADNLDVLHSLPTASVDLIYIDPLQHREGAIVHAVTHDAL